jgi:large subunit ribosomal protein L6
MSRIGKAPVELGQAEFSINNENVMTVKGPKGELKQWVDSRIEVSVEDGIVNLSRSSDHRDDRSLHGMYRALLANMVEGVMKGYEIKLELVGVGYRAKAQGQLLELSLGFSHPVHIHLPEEIKLTAETEKGKNPLITLASCDKQLVGAIASKIRSLRKPEPYKGKGIKYQGEYIRRKAGKAAASA